MYTPTATEIVKALAPAFVAGFAVQQAVEVVSSVAAFLPKFDDNVKVKKAVLSLVAVVFSWCIVCTLGLDVMQVFNPGNDCPSPFWHAVVTVIFISAGTEGFNSLLKWITYKKEDTKATAGAKKQALNKTDDATKQMPS